MTKYKRQRAIDRARIMRLLRQEMATHQNGMTSEQIATFVMDQIESVDFVRIDIKKLYIFDADATLRRCTIKDQPCPNRPGEWESISWAKETLSRIDWTVNGFGIVSNQAGVALGFMLPEVCMQMLVDLAVEMTGHRPRHGTIRVCPHAPNSCDCRKPKPLLIRKIIAEFGAANDQVVYVGDMESDQQAADAANVAFQWAWDFCGKTKDEWTAMLAGDQ